MDGDVSQGKYHTLCLTEQRRATIIGSTLHPSIPGMGRLVRVCRISEPVLRPEDAGKQET